MAKNTRELLGKVHRVAKASSISSDEKLPPVFKTGGDHLSCLLDKLQAGGLFQKLNRPDPILNRANDMVLHISRYDGPKPLFLGMGLVKSPHPVP
jgi:hypothetical protein